MKIQRRLAVSLEGKVHDAISYKIAQGGVIKPIQRAFVCFEEQVRQYYPKLTFGDPVPPPPPAPPPAETLEFTKYFDPSGIETGGVSVLRFTIYGESITSDAIGVGFTDSLPVGVDIASPANINNPVGGTLIAEAGLITLVGGTVEAGTNPVISVNVTSDLADTYSNTSSVLSSSLPDAGPATADLVVSAKIVKRITWTSDPILVKKWSNNPIVAVAAIIFYRDTGLYSYNNHPDQNIVEQYVNPPLVDTVDDGLLLIRVDQTSANGATITGTLGAWIDLNQTLLTWSLDQSVPGLLTETADITIAENDGLGAPIAGTDIVKPVTFESGQTPPDTKIDWTTVQRDLETITTAENAVCHFIVNQAGNAVGTATEGSFNDTWHEDYERTVPDLPSDPPEFTVSVNLVSGDAPTGNTFDTPLELDAGNYSWTLVAEAGEEKECVLDVTIADTYSSVVKRVTMYSEYTVAASSNVWESLPAWYLDDTGQDDVTVRMDADGYGYGLEGVTETKKEAWHSGAGGAITDGNDYEVAFEDNTALDVVNAGTITGDEYSEKDQPLIWHRLDQTRFVTYTRKSNIAEGFFLLTNVRRVGEAKVRKQTFMGNDP